MCSSDLGQLEALQLLIDHSADVNFRNNAGDTPLCKAITAREDQMMGNRVDIVRRLLEHGADSNPCDQNHSTLLHHASSHGMFEVARLLVSYGARVDVKDEEGRTSFQIASEKGYHEIAKLLSEHVIVP